MKLKCTRASILIFLTLLSSQALFAQTAGDYRSVITGSGNWSDPTTWERFNGTVWVTPGAAPTATDGLVTIKAGTTVTVDNDETANRVQVEAGATLQELNIDFSPHPLVVSDGNAGGDDFIVDGSFILRGFRGLSGLAGATAVINGNMNWIAGDLNIPTVISVGGTLDLTLDFSRNLNTSLNNFGTMNWAAGPTQGDIFMNNATFTNSGTLNEQFTGSGRGFIDAGGTNSISLLNTLVKTSTNAFSNGGIPVTMPGTITGIGTVNLTGSSVDVSGILQPGDLSGATSGILALNLNSITNRFPVFSIIIGSAGDVAGTNYDQILVPDNTGSIDLSGSTLNVSFLGANQDLDPIGTVYTVLSAPNGATFSGTFGGGTFLASTLAAPVITPTSVTVTKNSALPLTWGNFNALALQNNSVSLTWNTLQETNTSHFAVEYSTDGKSYTSIGKVTAAGNSSVSLPYSFIHTSPLLNGTNFYRLKQVDLDGKFTYSQIRTVRFAGGDVVKVLTYPNPVHDQLQFSVQDKGIIAYLHAADGKLLRTWQLQPGTRQVSLHDLPAGSYQLLIYQKQQKIQTQQILKF